jgi:hypothetical protein
MVNRLERGPQAAQDPAVREGRLDPGDLLDILARVDPTSRFAVEASRLLERTLVEGDAPFEMPPLPEPRLLTIATTAGDDFDGVYFAVQAIRFYHSEILDDVHFLVLDPDPEGPRAAALRGLGGWIPNYTYWGHRSNGASALDLLFRFGNSEFVLAMAPHVLFAPGALGALIAYLKCHRSTNDLLQGPLLSAARVVDPAGRPFEIPGQTPDLLVCRRLAWPGMNPRLVEGAGPDDYVHEKIRRAGGRVVCLPPLRWMRRDDGSGAGSSRQVGRDQVRNHLIAARELGLDPRPAVVAFEAMLGTQAVEEVGREVDDALEFFDAIYCMVSDRERGASAELREHLRAAGIERPVRRFTAARTPWDPEIGRSLARRSVIDEARWQALGNFLILEDGPALTASVIDGLRDCIPVMRERPWSIAQPGGDGWKVAFDAGAGISAGAAYLRTRGPAIAYHHTMYQGMLAAVPSTASGIARWLREQTGGGSVPAGR